MAAYRLKEEQTKGTLEPGRLTDLVIPAQSARGLVVDHVIAARGDMVEFR